MVDESELEGFKSTRYFSRSWALLTRDRGWMKPILLMTLALLVPIVGWLGVAGYVAEWARLTAWGVNSAPKQRGVRVGECIASGWRAFVVMLVWGVCMSVIAAVIAVVPLLGGLGAFAWFIFSFFLGIVVVVAVLRATIYQKIRAGLRVSTVWQMASHDAAGLIRVVGMEVAGMAIIWLICALVLLVSLANFLPQVFYLASYIDRYQAILSVDMQAILALQILGSLIGSFGPAILVIYLVCGLIGVILAMLIATAVALWMRQFDVSSWGREEDPIHVAEKDARPSDSSQPVAPGIPGAAPAGAPEAAEPAAAPEPEVVEVETVAAAPEPAQQVAPEPEPAAASEPEPAPASEPEVVEVETVAAAPEPEPAQEPEATPEPVSAPEPEEDSPIVDHSEERDEE